MAEVLLLGLAEWSIRAAILAGAVGILLWVARVKDAQVKLTAWTIVLGAVLLMPLASPVIPRVPIPVPSFLSRDSSHAQQAQSRFNLPPPSRDFAAPPAETSRIDWAATAVGVWLCVALGMCLRLVVGVRLSARLVDSSRLTEEGIRESGLVSVPITVGIVSPVVVLPMEWREWPELKLRAVLAHERSHVLRRDPLRQLAASIYRSIAWFHPLAWWLRKQLMDLAEEASDDAALRVAEDRVQYAEALLGFIKRTPRRVQWEGVTMANRQTRMRRIDRVLDQNRKLSGSSSNRAMAALILAAIPLLYVTTAARLVWAQAPTTSLPAVPGISASAQFCGGNPAYAKWVNEDVAFIIAPEERQAFEHLGAEAECAIFEDQFWMRRDPTPGTPENEFKQEHYRRIAYANERFASNRTAGWGTDRGRIYITYGPPDEIESHPAGGGQSNPAEPFEQWLYRHNNALGNDVLFEFVDGARDNAYALAFLGAPQGREAGRPAVFGLVGGLYVEVNANRTVSIAAPVRGTSVPVHGRIVDSNGTMVKAFDDVNRSSIYGITYSLPAGKYVLYLEVDSDKRALTFEVQ